MFGLANLAGMPIRVTKLILHMVVCSQRFYIVRSFCTKPKFAGYGIFQGCPMSLFLVILLLSVWARLLDTIREGVTPKAFVDDRSVYTTTLPALLKALKLTLQFDSFCANIINVEKTHVLVSNSGLIEDLQKQIR